MRTLWTFGDSFTESYNSKYEWANQYIQWKGYTPKVYGEMISDKLGIEYKNKGLGGNSNYDIFESICKSIDFIKDGDIIIVGWANILRFRLVDTTINGDRWQSIQPSYNKLKNISENTVNEILINRSNTELYRQEIENWMKLLRYTFKNNTILFWSWSGRDWGLVNDGYENIRYETGGKVDDSHWSENGHREFTELILPELETKTYINLLRN